LGGINPLVSAGGGKYPETLITFGDYIDVALTLSAIEEAMKEPDTGANSNSEKKATMDTIGSYSMFIENGPKLYDNYRVVKNKKDTFNVKVPAKK
jgi:hypothetical protein